jgi:hypothetical protein
MLGPVSSVKEQTLPRYAERLSDAGFTVLTVDPRSFAASEGEPRWHYVPEHVIADYVNACAYMMTRPTSTPRASLPSACAWAGGSRSRPRPAIIASLRT